MGRVWIMGLSLVGIVIQPGCRRTADHPLRLFDVDERQLIASAETVVLGTTVGVEWQPDTRSLDWEKQAGVSRVRLVKVELKVEEEIVGAAGGAGELSVKYWAPDGATNGHDLHFPEIGERAVHYLVRDSGGVRYVADVMRSSTPVYSGRHTRQALAKKARPEARIAALLLTRGEGMQTDKFIRRFSSPVAVSLGLVGYAGTAPLLTALVEDPNPEVAWRACELLYRYRFDGLDGCLERMAPPPGWPAWEPKIGELRMLRREEGELLRHRFPQNPVGYAEQRAILPGRGGVADYLRLLSQHPDRVIADRAKIALGEVGGP